MIDILPYVAELLAPTNAQFELSYNGITANIPLIVISETDNRADIIVDGADVYSGIAVQLDCYHYDDERVRSLAIAASGYMTTAGFRRSSFSALPEQNLKRITMTFAASVDEISKRLYSGANI